MNWGKLHFFNDAIVAESQNLTREPKLPRKQQPPKQMGESDGFHPKRPWEFFRHLYYEAIDIIASEISQWFDLKGLGILNEIF